MKVILLEKVSLQINLEMSLPGLLVCVCLDSNVWPFATPWTIACQAPLSVGFSRQEYWSGFPFPSPWDLLDSGIEPGYPVSPVLACRFFTVWSSREVLNPTTVFLQETEGKKDVNRKEWGPSEERQRLAWCIHKPRNSQATRRRKRQGVFFPWDYGGSALLLSPQF